MVSSICRKFLALIVFSSLIIAASSATCVTIFTAEKIITMEPDQPIVKAIAIKNGEIAALGNLETLSPLIEKYGGIIDRSLENMVILPGFIDAHVHPTLPAILTQFPFIAPEKWSLPTGEFPASTTPDDYLKRLKHFVFNHQGDEPFITWGYHPLWHGEINRKELSALFPNTPVIIWHRSFHELITNDFAISWLGLQESSFENYTEVVDWERGYFKEGALVKLMPKLGFLFEPERFAYGVENFLSMLHKGGVTTALDMGFGIFGNPEKEIELIRRVAEARESPSRIVLTPIITTFLTQNKSPEEALWEIDSWREKNSRRVIIDKHFKLLLDGAIFSGLAQMSPPGYLDGHQGIWMVPLPITRLWAQTFWNAGYKLHAHTNGDMSTEVLLNLVNDLSTSFPREDHGTTLEHFAYTREEQNVAIRELDMMVSANPYYNYILSDIYSGKWLGPKRASKMVKLGSLERLGVPFALHSDCPMAPLNPLMLAWAAATRLTINGNLNSLDQRISLESAIRAITIDAAKVMGWDHKIGSIRKGKIADFTILDSDPFKVGASGLKNIKVMGTIFEGTLKWIEDSENHP